jgi:undecaprenyl-diphosphatase
VNQFAQRSGLFDLVIAALANNLLFNGGIITALMWAGWVRKSPDKEKERSYLISGLFLSLVALAAARTLALSLPFRNRPRYTAELGFRMPAIHPGFSLIHWSAFPSDHAVLFFSLATALFLVSRKIGFFAYCHAVLVVSFPLLYLGVHYPTDLIAGALIGVGFGSLAAVDRVRDAIAKPAFRWQANSPATFYPFLYLCTLLTATQFDSVRMIAVGFWEVLKGKV